MKRVHMYSIQVGKPVIRTIFQQIMRPAKHKQPFTRCTSRPLCNTPTKYNISNENFKHVSLHRHKSKRRLHHSLLSLLTMVCCMQDAWHSCLHWCCIPPICCGDASARHESGVGQFCQFGTKINYYSPLSDRKINVRSIISNQSWKFGQHRLV